MPARPSRRGTLTVVQPPATSLLLGLASLLLAGCAASAPEPHRPHAPTAASSPSTSGPTKPPTKPPTRAELAYDRMTPDQRVGQLFMIGLTSTGPTPQMYAALTAHSGGNAFLRGPSDLGVGRMAAVTARIKAAGTVAGVRPFVSADQEGGNAQALTGPGFSEMPTALTQGGMDAGGLRRDAQSWARELRAAGVTLDLAPVADVVPAAVGTANEPIGSFRREYGYTPQTAAPGVAAFVRGTQQQGVAATLKHFPGLGRATGNTDSDPTATDPTVRDDPLLGAFRQGIEAGAAFAMVSSAHYPGIDRTARACFSPLVIRAMLRGDLGFDGVVVSDSFGSASVSSVRPGPRAVRFLQAGGTMVLDTNYLDLAPMTAAVLARARRDSDFADVVEADVRLVLATKERFHLLA